MFASVLSRSHLAVASTTERARKRECEREGVEIEKSRVLNNVSQT